MPVFKGITINLEPDMPHDPKAAAQYALLINYPYDEASIGNLIRKSPSETRRWLEAQRKDWAFYEYTEAIMSKGERCVRRDAPPDRCPHIDVELYFRFDGDVEAADDEDEVGNSCTMTYVNHFFLFNQMGDGLWAGDWRPTRGYCAIVALKVLDYLTKGSTDSLTSSMRNLGL
ncbi:hypothetical protein MGN70_000367 [Eutypa lata]|uniref:Uncharacterized protein n=1 Tax=Eutypa lata (strain UCR-EL1) TaxID=1287681 RepID=M7SE08_EUTLA|nr:hypothetical protein UCREL1_10620 [Eutypa lata UCREL1]KAI1257327.1 hypothetical protein MGN70_000367 [Eutypa lata]